MNRVLKKAAIFTLGNAIVAVVPLVLVPVLTRNLTTSEYGEIGLFIAANLLLKPLIGANVPGALNRLYFDRKSLDENHNVSTGLALVLINATAITIIAVMGLSTGLIPYSVPTTILPIITATLQQIVTIRLGQWQIRGEAKSFVTLQVASAIFNISISLIFLLYLVGGSGGRIYGIVLSTLLVTAISVASLKKDDLLKLRFQKKAAIAILAFGLPLVPHSVSLVLFSTVDRYILERYIGLEAVGIYTAAFQISMVIYMVNDGVNKAIIPWVYGKLKILGSEFFKEYKMAMVVIYIILLALSISLYYIAPPILSPILGSGFNDAIGLIGVLCAAQMVRGIGTFASAFLFFSKNTGILSMISIITAFSHLVIVIKFVEYFGVPGVAYAYLISAIIRSILIIGITALRPKESWDSVDY